MRKQINHTPPLPIETNCDNLFVPGGPLPDANNISDSAQYTCSILNPTPSNLIYQDIPPNRAQVVKLTASGTTSSLLISWQNTDRTKTNFPPTRPNPNFPGETAWNSSPNNYGPILRVTLYPVAASGAITANTQTFSKTFFFIPTGSAINPYPYTTTADGSILDAYCNTQHYMSLGAFNGTRDLDCAVNITGLGSILGFGAVDHYYAVLTPIYGQADIKLKANGPANVVRNFQNSQAVIDVTGTSNGISKRLQARANITGGGSVDAASNSIPDQALRSASAICKRLSVGDTKILVEGADCNLTITP